MNTLLVIFTNLLIFSTVNSQIVHYPRRNRNFSIGSESNSSHGNNNDQIVHYAGRIRTADIQSETNNVYVIESKIYRDKNEHKIAASVNVTKDFRIKNVVVTLYRCSSEIVDCEDFQTWKFTHSLKSIVYMKNQIWTPIFEHVTPKLDHLPLLKKNIYQVPSANVDAEAIVKLYNEAPNYIWRCEAIARDYADKKALIGNIELTIFTFVERNKTKNRRRNSPDLGKQ